MIEASAVAAPGVVVPVREARTTGWDIRTLEQSKAWRFVLEPSAALELLRVVRKVTTAEKSLLSYRRSDFPIAHLLDVFHAAMAEVTDGLGIALISGLPRQDVSESEFSLMTWAIGLHLGVARPQDRHTAYLNKVKDIGTDYRSPTGRGYSSNAKLDFHVDGSDVVLLSCFNQAPEGGMSICTSSIRAYQVLCEERPDLAPAMKELFPFSRNGEHQADESAWFMAPLVGEQDGLRFVAWNRNRLVNALKLEHVPPITALQWEAVGYFDGLLRRPDLMYATMLKPGDLQILNNQTTLHSRTAFVDSKREDEKRTLYRLWLAVPNSRRLPPMWEHYAGTRQEATVRGGSRGFKYDDACREFDRAQAAVSGMKLPEFLI
jgi:hypothetical protein